MALRNSAIQKTKKAANENEKVIKIEVAYNYINTNVSPLLMKISKIYNLERWEIILLTISVASIVISYFFKDNSFLLSTFIGAATCIITAILILYFQRIHRSLKLYSYYKTISGRYTRTDIGQDNTSIKKSAWLKEQNIGLHIDLNYVNENKFSADIEFWKDDKAKATAIVEFSETNKLFASGTYKYYQGEGYINHFGFLELFRFEAEPRKIYVKHQHVFPRETENNPDNNRGWQIWELENRC